MSTPDGTRQTLRIIYGRASLDKVGNGQTKSVDSQLLDEINRADRDGVEIATGGTGPRGTFRDDGISASRFAKGKVREEWLKVMALIHSDTTIPGDELAVWDISRSTRDRAMWAQLIGALIMAEMLLLVDGKRHDPSDPDDGFMLDLGAAMAFRDSAKLSKNLNKAVRHRAAEGMPSGPIPYGYRMTFDDKGNKTGRVVHPEEGPIVQECARRILDGETATAIAEDLNARGLVASRGGRWTGNIVVKLVGRPCFARIVSFQGKPMPEVIGQWPELISVADHRELVAKFTAPDRLAVRNGKHSRHLGSGIYECGRCGGRCRTVSRSAKEGHRIAYSCRTAFCVNRPAAEVDAVVAAIVVARLADPGLLAALAASGDDPAVAAAARDAAVLALRLDQAREMAALGDLPLASLAAMERAIGPRLAAAKDRGTPRHVPATVLAMAGPSAAERWAAAPMPLRREVLAALVRVVIDPTTRRGVAAMGTHTAEELCVTITPR